MRFVEKLYGNIVHRPLIDGGETINPLSIISGSHVFEVEGTNNSCLGPFSSKNA